MGRRKLKKPIVCMWLDDVSKLVSNFTSGKNRTIGPIFREEYLPAGSRIGEDHIIYNLRSANQLIEIIEDRLDFLREYCEYGDKLLHAYIDKYGELEDFDE